MTRVDVFAPAKVNLSLHVTGQRDDGYHLLDSLVCFAAVGDKVFAEPADELTLSVTGPFADDVPDGPDNLMLKAARMMGDGGAALALEKVLPVASGIGGGSADAAATVRALATVWGASVPADLVSLGADVPVCLHQSAVRMRGVGEQIVAVPPLPLVHAVLVNPRVPVSTPDVFNALSLKENVPMPYEVPAFDGVAELIAWLAQTRNDLQAPAIKVAPVVQEVLDALGRSAFARMSGSGATCFGLYATASEASADARRISQIMPEWWVAATTLS
jgi:4-diphosphocytidyl-2-C-methyl-D-erythritol kinase